MMKQLEEKSLKLNDYTDDLQKLVGLPYSEKKTRIKGLACAKNKLCLM